MPNRSEGADAAPNDFSSLPSALSTWIELPRRQFALVLSMQADYLRFVVQQTTHFWSEVSNAMLKWQADVATTAGEAMLDAAPEPTLESLQRAFAATLDESKAGEATPTH